MVGGGCGRGSARRVVGMWMNSPGHRAILLSGKLPPDRPRASAPARLGGTQACVVTADFGPSCRRMSEAAAQRSA